MHMLVSRVRCARKGVSIEVINRSEHPIHVRWAGFEVDRAADRWLEIPQNIFGQPVGGTVPPRGRYSIEVAAESLRRAGIDPFGPLIAQ